MLALWAEILRRVPEARLLLKNVRPGRETLSHMGQRAVRAGIDPARLTLRPGSKDYLRDYLDVDIILDTFPYQGGGTTCEALFMGLPVVTRAGDRHGARFGASLLTKRALEVWPIPAMDEATRKAYLLERKGDSQRKTVTFRDLFNAGLIREGDVLTSAHPRWGGSATVTADGAILLPNGQEFSSPSPALVRLFALEGSSPNAANGWWYMRLGEDGPRLHDLRTQLQETKAETERERFRLAYWDGYYELCAESQAFVDAFGDPTERMQNSDWWASFGIGLGNCHLENRAGRRDHNADSGIYFPSGEGYDRLYARRAEVESLLSDPGSEMMWSEPDASTKYRALWLRRDFDYDEQDWSEAQVWMRDMLLRLRAIALEVFS